MFKLQKLNREEIASGCRRIFNPNNMKRINNRRHFLNNGQQGFLASAIGDPVTSAKWPWGVNTSWFQVFSFKYRYLRWKMYCKN